MLRSVFFVVCVVLFECTSTARADDPECYTSGSIAGIVIATVVVTLVMGGLAAAFIWYLWKQRKAGYGDNKSMEKPIMCPPMSPDKQLIVRESNDYAFDNPYFKDDETDNTNPDAAEKGESGFRTDNGDITPGQNAKASNGTTGSNHQHKKSRPFSSLPFHAVFHPSGKKQQRATMDDTYISKHLERITVPLRGHDFTGLGFNICGNMRDGIFVKDVLHRGPASESGKIKAGDRIVGVTVSFGAMVYEDALTILSYASPYDVKLEIEKAPATLAGGPHLPPSSPKRLGASTSFRSNGQRRLFHPLYRSQSIDDLTQIGKDGFGVVNTPGSQRDSTSSATPKRSQSVEASNGGLKTRPPFILKAEETKSSSSSSKGSRQSSTSSYESTSKVATSPDRVHGAANEEEPCVRKEAKSARFRTEQINVKSEALLKIPPAKPARDLPEEKQPVNNAKEQIVPDAVDKTPTSSTKVSDDVFLDESPKSSAVPADSANGPESDVDAERPTAPPRKASTPKRRAPAPPPAPAPSAKTETSAVVHRVDDLPQESKVTVQDSSTQEVSNSDIPPPPPESELPPANDEQLNHLEKETFSVREELQTVVQDLPVFSSREKISDPGIGSSDNSSLASGDTSSTKMEKDEQNASPGKRKASSLGDLTKLEHGTSKKTSVSSAILERAVSLDFQQSFPGENLKQKKILHAPTFEDDCEEDREDLSDINGPGLKRWEDGLDIVFARLPNGDAKLNSNFSKCEAKASSDIDIKFETNGTDTLDKLETETVKDSSTEKPSESLEDDSPVGELPPINSQELTSTTLFTSTPVKRIIEVKNLPKDDDEDEMDDVPFMASGKIQKGEESSSKNPAKTSGGSAGVFSPVTISIPVIKPDLTHFEKLPSPPPTSTHPGLDASWRMSKTLTSDENGKTSLEKISVQSLYRPIFTSKEINNVDEPVLQTSTEKMVNGNESDASEHYSTAQENTSTSSVETSTLSLTLSNPVAKEVILKAPSTIAGFAKTLIIPSPNDVENLLSLAKEPNTPPPILADPPAKPVENK